MSQNLKSIQEEGRGSGVGQNPFLDRSLDGGSPDLDVYLK